MSGPRGASTPDGGSKGPGKDLASPGKAEAQGSPLGATKSRAESLAPSASSSGHQPEKVKDSGEALSPTYAQRARKATPSPERKGVAMGCLPP